MLVRAAPDADRSDLGEHALLDDAAAPQFSVVRIGEGHQRWGSGAVGRWPAAVALPVGVTRGRARR
ncbi:hypothetical protein EAO75_33770 [Streptomyces sp. uw30]|nr:hypothetical protein EAO75_33770 [Streptomyces sp. uw30]